MKHAFVAGLITSSVLMQATLVLAAEGSELRGLKPTPRTFGLDVESVRPEPATEGLKWSNIDALGQLASRLSLYGGTLETHNFNFDNLRFSAARYSPLGQPSGVFGETGRHPLYSSLPKYALYNHVTRTLPGGWGLGFGIRQSEYNFGSAQLLSLSAERYFGNFRSAYTLYGSTDGGSLNSAQRFQVDYLYGERNTVGLSYTMGRDFDQPVGFGMPLNDARDFTLSGRHWFSPNWALTYDVLSQDQGTLLRRQGLRLGVSRSF